MGTGRGTVRSVGDRFVSVRIDPISAVRKAACQHVLPPRAKESYAYPLS